MRDSSRIEPFLQKLGELWHCLPDYRFGQLICRLAGELGQDIFFPEENEWLRAIDKTTAIAEKYERDNLKIEVTRNDLYKLVEELMNSKSEGK